MKKFANIVFGKIEFKHNYNNIIIYNGFKKRILKISQYLY